MTVVAWAGDSITEGAGASAAGKRWVSQVLKFLGARVSQHSVNAGVGGEKSADVLARVDDILADSPGLLFVMVGTNDAGWAVPLATYQQNITDIAAAADAAGVAVAFGLVPPRGDAAELVATYNLWLPSWCHRRGILCVDTFSPLADGGALAALCDNGDGVHPNDAGHLAIATAIAEALESRLPLPALPIGGGITSGPWVHTAGPAGSLSTVDGYTRITVVTGLSTYSLPFGVEGTDWGEGDLLLVVMRARGSSAVALNKIQLQDGSAPAGAIIESGFPTATPGPLLRTVTVPAVAGTLRLGVNVDARSGSVWVDVIADVYNLTRMGLEDLEV